MEKDSGSYMFSVLAENRKHIWSRIFLHCNSKALFTYIPCINICVFQPPLHEQAHPGVSSVRNGKPTTSSLWGFKSTSFWQTFLTMMLDSTPQCLVAGILQYKCFITSSIVNGLSYNFAIFDTAAVKSHHIFGALQIGDSLVVVQASFKYFLHNISSTFHLGSFLCSLYFWINMQNTSSSRVLSHTQALSKNSP